MPLTPDQRLLLRRVFAIAAFVFAALAAIFTEVNTGASAPWLLPAAIAMIALAIFIK